MQTATQLQTEKMEKFKNKEFLKNIKDVEKWTISTNRKIPCDIKTYLSTGMLHGAKYMDSRCLTTLEHLYQTFPTMANAAYFADAILDKFVVLDIEPSCPQNIRDEFLKTNYIYGETSMSGKGLHLVYHLPPDVHNFPDALQKKVWKEEHGYYEFMINHWITFTGTVLDIESNPGGYDISPTILAVASQQKATTHTEFEVTLDDNEIQRFDEIIDIMNHQTYHKTPEDFSNDMSKYETGHIGFLFNTLLKILSAYTSQGCVYSDSDKLRLLYESAKNKVPYRQKHDQYRSNMPWLLYLSHMILNTFESQKL